MKLNSKTAMDETDFKVSSLSGFVNFQINIFYMFRIIFQISFCFFLFHSFSFVQAQNTIHCGTEIDASNIESLRQQNQQWNLAGQNNNSRAYSGTTHFVPVQIHIIRETAGTGGISGGDALAAFDRMNEFYIDASVHFFQCSPVNFIDNSTYYNYDKTQKSALDAAYGVSDVVNIYVANTVTSGTTPICGHSTFPGGLDFLIQSTSCMKNGSTLSHEMGHYMGLYHTHETSFGDEAVNGSDCNGEGDLICDTPADPRLSTSSNLNQSGCIYYGTDTDENGQPYSPMVNNLMSYSGKGCRTEFTTMQQAKILNTLTVSRSYLNCGISVSTDAKFYVRSTPDCTTGKQFDFYNISLGNPTIYIWNFGDGSGVSAQESPTYSYANPGVYTVSLTIIGLSGTDNYTQQVTVGAVTPPYSNDFESGLSSLDMFDSRESMKNVSGLSTASANSGTNSLVFEGTDSFATQPYFKTPAVATVFDPLFNPYYKSERFLCVDATNHSNMQLEFDKKQIRFTDDDYTNLRITVNGSLINSVIQVDNNNLDDASFIHVTVDLSAYDGQVFTIGFEGSHKFSTDRIAVNDGTATFIDDINITGTTVIASLEGSLSEDRLQKSFPNPASEWINIDGYNSESGTLKIFNSLGQSVLDRVSVEVQNEYQIRINLFNLDSGLYFIHTGNFVHKVKKIQNN
jgi:PKD repeat protein